MVFQHSNSKSKAEILPWKWGGSWALTLDQELKATETKRNSPSQGRTSNSCIFTSNIIKTGEVAFIYSGTYTDTHTDTDTHTQRHRHRHRRTHTHQQLKQRRPWIWKRARQHGRVRQRKGGKGDCCNYVSKTFETRVSKKKESWESHGAGAQKLHPPQSLL